MIHAMGQNTWHNSSRQASHDETLNGDQMDFARWLSSHTALYASSGQHPPVDTKHL